MTQDTAGLVVVVAAPKELDTYTAVDMRIELREAVEQGAQLVIADLAATEYMDSSGLGVLVGGLRRARASECGFGVACSRELLLNKIRLCGLLKVFDVRSSVDDFGREDQP